jgi:8-oxo-dGTP diphosphatase
MIPMNQPTLNEISIDCIIFGFNNGILEILLVKHAVGDSKGEWGLPGGFIKEKEGIDDAAQRLLWELTGLDNIFLEQIKAFGKPNRIPFSRVITIGYYALIKREEYDIKAGLTVFEAKWYKMDEVPNLIYDHNEILDFGLKKLQTRILNAPIGFNLLPEKFTLLQLMHLYEEILGKELDKSNFRRKILKMKLLVALEEKQQDVSHRAAKLYQFDSKIYAKLSQKGFNFEI